MFSSSMIILWYATWEYCYLLFWNWSKKKYLLTKHYLRSFQLQMTSQPGQKQWTKMPENTAPLDWSWRSKTRRCRTPLSRAQEMTPWWNRLDFEKSPKIQRQHTWSQWCRYPWKMLYERRFLACTFHRGVTPETPQARIHQRPGHTQRRWLLCALLLWDRKGPEKIFLYFLHI